MRRSFAQMKEGRDICRTPLQSLPVLWEEIRQRTGRKIFHRLLESLELEKCEYSEENIDILTGSVNAERLKNHPVRLSEAVIRQLYTQMMRD